jgi:hypothetical protein
MMPHRHPGKSDLHDGVRYVYMGLGDQFDGARFGTYSAG